MAQQADLIEISPVRQIGLDTSNIPFYTKWLYDLIVSFNVRQDLQQKMGKKLGFFLPIFPKLSAVYSLTK